MVIKLKRVFTFIFKKDYFADGACALTADAFMETLTVVALYLHLYSPRKVE